MQFCDVAPVTRWLVLVESSSTSSLLAAANRYTDCATSNCTVWRCNNLCHFSHTAWCLSLLCWKPLIGRLMTQTTPLVHKNRRLTSPAHPRFPCQSYCPATIQIWFICFLTGLKTSEISHVAPLGGCRNLLCSWRGRLCRMIVSCSLYVDGKKKQNTYRGLEKGTWCNTELWCTACWWCWPDLHPSAGLRLFLPSC